MNCPACGSPEARIMRTIMAPSVDRRQRKCRCGVVWNTTERVDAGSIRTPIEVKGESGNAQPCHALNGATKTQGSLVLSISNQPESSDPKSESSLLGKPRARERKGRPNAHEYTPEFEAFWGALTMRTGNKKPAFAAWVKVPVEIRANVERLIFVFNRWCETERWQNGAPLHVSTWINQAGWENEPAPQLFRRAQPSKFEPAAVRAEREREERVIDERALSAFGVRR